MRDLLLFLFVFGSLPISFMNPRVGLLIWAWLGYMNPHRLTWSYAYNMRFVFISALVTLLGVWFAKPGEKRSIPITSVTVFWMVLIFWFTLTAMFALNPGRVWWEWERTMKIQLMVMATLMLHTDRRWLTMAVWVMVLSIGFWGVKGGIFTLLHGGQYRVMGPHGTFFRDNNTLALALITVYPFIYFLLLQSSKRWLRWGLWGLLGVTATAILGTYSRGGFMGASVMVGYFFLKSRRPFLLLLTLAPMLFFALDFMPQKWGQRMESIQGYEQDRSAMGRINSWKFAVNLALDRPFIGGGFQVFTPANFQRWAPDPTDFHDAHSIYFEILAEQGFVGLLLFLGMYFFAFRAGGWVVARTRGRADLHWARDLASMCQVSLVGYAATGAMLGMAYFDLPFHVMAVLVLVKEEVKRQLAQAREAEAPVASIPPNSIFAGV